MEIPRLSFVRFSLILALLVSGHSHAQGDDRNQAEQLQDALFACHIRASLVNLDEPVFWDDLVPCNQATQESGRQLSSEQYLTTLLNRAILLMELTEFDRAREDLEVASVVDPLSPHLQINLGLLNFLEQKYEDAIGNFSLAAENDELRALALFNRCLAYGYSDNFDLALQDLTQLKLEYPQEFSFWVSSEQSDFFPALLAGLPE